MSPQPATYNWTNERTISSQSCCELEYEYDDGSHMRGAISDVWCVMDVCVCVFCFFFWGGGEQWQLPKERLSHG